MGLELGVTPTLCRAQLQAGDRLLLYTDGVVEARDEHGKPFGLQRFTDLILRREADGCPPPETLRRLMRMLLEHQHGRLQDDATVMLVEWRSGQHRRLLM
jgi:serine phosphatase RsbU (regulator of sigma subunit)